MHLEFYVVCCTMLHVTDSKMFDSKHIRMIQRLKQEILPNYTGYINRSGRV